MSDFGKVIKVHTAPEVETGGVEIVSVPVQPSERAARKRQEREAQPAAPERHAPVREPVRRTVRRTIRRKPTRSAPWKPIPAGIPKPVAPIKQPEKVGEK